MAKAKHWIIELDFNANPDLQRDEAIERLRDWYDDTKGFVRIEDNTVVVAETAEVVALKVRLHGNLVSLRKVAV